jgi:glycosyltransferase involved in cell wall biosynthesis
MSEGTIRTELAQPMRNPRITVLIPALNAENFIADSINSVLAQDWPDFELLVINDGSTDATAAIAQSFADPRIRIHHNPVNLGIATSGNIGLAMARGEFIARLDSDDIAIPNRLSTQLRFMEDHPEVTACGGKMEVFGKGSGIADVLIADADIKAMFLAAAGNIMNPTAFFRRDFVVQNHISYQQNFAPADDLAFWIDCMRAGAYFANLDNVITRYRLHAANSSTRSSYLRHAVFAIRRQLIFDFFPDLTAREATSLARMFDLRADLSAHSVSASLKAAEKARVEQVSRFGENRALITAELDRQMAQLQTRWSEAEI